MPTYVQRPDVEVQATQWTGDNPTEVSLFLGERLVATNEFEPGQPELVVLTTRGAVRAVPGDWLVRRGVDDAAVVPEDDFETLYQIPEGD